MNSTIINCPDCRTHIRAKKEKNRWVKWIDIVCDCGFKRRLKEIEMDCIQPSSPLWKLVYDTNPFDNYNKELDNKKRREENRKDRLDSEYNLKFKKPWERKFVKDMVLNKGVEELLNGK